MPSAPQPKRFVAACDFLYAGHQYRKGDLVEDRAVIQALTKFKSRFIAHQAAKAETPANPDRDAADTPVDPPKE